MRKIDTIIVHCSATKAWQDFTAADVDRWHRERGFDGIGYHYVIRLNGRIERGREVALPGAHCRGWNARSIGICYIGGLDANGQPADTMTNAQKRILYQLITELRRDYPSVNLVIGHRDASPDANGNGVIEPAEYLKACPCFDVKEFMRTARRLLFVLLAVCMLPLALSACGSGKVVGSSRSTVDSTEVLMGMGSWVGQSISSQRADEQVVEHIEETVLVFERDSIGGLNGANGRWERRVIDRKVKKGAEQVVQHYTESRDSVASFHRSTVGKEAMTKEGKHPAVLKWVLVLGLLGGGGYVWMKINRQH